MKKILLLLTFSFIFSLVSRGNIYTVTLANQTGWIGLSGSWSDVLDKATSNPGRDTIEFNLPGGSNIFNWGPTLTSLQGNVFINGLSKQDGNPVVFNFDFRIQGSLVHIYGVQFTTTLHSLTISGSNNTVDSCFFTVTGDGQNALWLNGGNNNLVKNSVFNTSKLHAVSIENGGNHLVDNCIVLNTNDVGIILRGSGNNVVRNCKVSNGNHNGIGLISGNNIIEYCETFNNARAGIVADNTLGGCTDNIIRNNKVYNNNTNYWLNVSNQPSPDQGGIQSNGPRTFITNNWVYGNAGNGILVNKLPDVSGASNSEIRNNIVGRDSLGNEIGNQWNGIFVWECNNVIVENNIVVNNGGGVSHGSFSMPDRVSGIRFQQVTSGSILTNLIGTDITKKVVGNAFDGITLHTNVSNVVVTGNVINNNGFNSTYGAGGGIALRNVVTNCTIQSNLIGIYADNTDGGNNDYGIAIEVGNNNLIGGNNPSLGNVIANSKNSGNQGAGVWLVLQGNSQNRFFNNLITDNNNDGVLIERGAERNEVGGINSGNIIARNKNGIRIQQGTGSASNLNILRGNSFVCNSEQGILLNTGGNNLYGKPITGKTIQVESNEKRANFVSGYAPSENAVVDIYVKDTLCRVDCDNNSSQGALYVASVTAAASASPNGLFMWEFDLTSPANLGNVVTKNNVIVMATQAGAVPQNSSEFSICTPEIVCVPPTNVTITGTNNVCTGGNSTLTANADDLTVGEDYTYSWYLGSVDPLNLVASNTNNNILQVSTSGNYIVVVANTIDVDACNDRNDAPFTFTVSQTPTNAGITGDNVACSGDNVTLTANATIDNNVTNTYSWYRNTVNPAGLVVANSTNTLSVNQAGSYFVIVTNSANTACRDTNNTPFVFTVSQTPVIADITGDNNVCTGESSTLTANATVDNNVTNTFAWYRGTVSPGNLLATNNNNTISVDQTGNYFVVVTNSANTECTDTVNTAFSFTVSQTPTNTNISGDNVACSGDNVTLTANATIDNNVTNTYSWYRNTVNPAGLVVANSTNTLSVNQAGSYFVIVTNSANAACRDTNNTPFVFTVSQTPVIADITGDDNVCTGESSTLTANATVDNNVTNTYAWYRGTVSPGNLLATNNNNTISVDQTGNYFVVVTNSANTECTDTVNTAFSFTVSQTPTNTNISGDNAACTGDNVTLTANATIDNNVTNTYSWYRNTVNTAGLVVANSTNTLSVNQAGSYFVIVTNSANAACRDTNNTPFVFTVSQTPVIADITGDNNVCTGESSTLTANATVDNNVTNTYAWYRGTVSPGNLLATNNNNTISVDQTGNYFVVVTNSANTECTDTVNTAFSFTVSQTPTNTNISGDNAACIGDNVTLTANATIDNNVTNTYSWYRNTVNPAGLVVANSTNTLSVNQAGSYFVIVTNSVNTECRDTNNTPFDFTVSQTPVIVDITGDDNVCTGESSTLTANATVDNNVTITYAWYRGTVSPGNLLATNNNNTINVDQTGNYFVVVTNLANTECTDTVNSAFNFTVNQTPSNTDITGDNSVCTGESSTLTAIADIDNGASNTYNWYRNTVSPAGLIVANSTNTLSVNEAGSYFVVVVNGNNTDCRDTINNPFVFEINSIPAVEILQNDTTICVRKNQTVNVTVTTTATNPIIVWSNGLAANQLTNTVSQAPVYLIATVTDENNCSDTAGIRIGVQCPPVDVKLPNVFVPNGDNTKNNVFTPIDENNNLVGGILKSHLEIYNRWGVKMYETEDLIPVWDGNFNGRSVPAGTYFWIWKYTDISDVSYNKNGYVQALGVK